MSFLYHDPSNHLLDAIQLAQNKLVRLMNNKTLLDKINTKTLLDNVNMLSGNQLSSIRLVGTRKSPGTGISLVVKAGVAPELVGCGCVGVEDDVVGVGADELWRLSHSAVAVIGLVFFLLLDSTPPHAGPVKNG